MSQTREEQLKKFMEEQKDRVSDTMISNTKILELLNTKGTKVFIPDGEWRGLQGLEELYPEKYYYYIFMSKYICRMYVHMVVW